MRDEHPNQLELPFGPRQYTEDPTVNGVIQQFVDRSAEGMKKYGTTMADNKLSLVAWLQHLQEELMDACNYIQRAKQELDVHGVFIPLDGRECENCKHADLNIDRFPCSVCTTTGDANWKTKYWMPRDAK